MWGAVGVKRGDACKVLGTSPGAISTQHARVLVMAVAVVTINIIVVVGTALASLTSLWTCLEVWVVLSFWITQLFGLCGLLHPSAVLCLQMPLLPWLPHKAWQLNLRGHSWS